MQHITEIWFPDAYKIRFRKSSTFTTLFLNKFICSASKFPHTGPECHKHVKRHICTCSGTSCMCRPTVCGLSRFADFPILYHSRAATEVSTQWWGYFPYLQKERGEEAAAAKWGALDAASVFCINHGNLAHWAAQEWAGRWNSTSCCHFPSVSCWHPC